MRREESEEEDISRRTLRLGAVRGEGRVRGREESEEEDFKGGLLRLGVVVSNGTGVPKRARATDQLALPINEFEY